LFESGFSERQRRVLRWWHPNSPDSRYDALICDGAVRSGKTLCLGLSFFLWAMASFSGQRFAVCGKTITSVRRNVVSVLTTYLTRFGMQVKEVRGENRLNVRFLGRENDFYLFGGRDEASASLIQGVTLAGVLLDEVALMPRSFVEQACARCSVAGSRLFFNCNPEGPQHWFYREWIEKAEERGALRLHFTMADNPSLTDEIRQRYERLYSGVFYERFVKGLWAGAQGRVYDFFSPEMAKPVPDGPFSRFFISCDYGTANPASFGLWGEKDGVYYRVSEYYYDSRREGRQCTDSEYLSALTALAGKRAIEKVIVDPSAASFITLLKQNGWQVEKANNDVLTGIRRTGDLLKSGKVVICETCTDCLREFDLYCWDEGAAGDRVKKQHDHAMDEVRYFCMSICSQRPGGFAAKSVARGRG